MSHEHPEREQAEHGKAGDQQAGAGQPSEEELRARLEEELRRITVRDVLLQTVVSLINIGGQRLGLGEDGGEVRDLDQVRLAIEGVRALLPLIEQENPEQVRPVRDALSQLQMVYAREAGGAAPGGGEPGGRGEPGGGGGAPPSGTQAGTQRPQPRRGEPGGLWVPPGSAT
jgi:hypothetical protein